MANAETGTKRGKRTNKIHRAASDLDAEPQVVEHASVYFGAARLAEVKERADGKGLSLSAFVAAACDTMPDLDPPTLAKLDAMATLRGVSRAELVRRLVLDAIRTAS